MKPWIIHATARYMASLIEGNMDENGDIDYWTHVTLYSIFGEVPEEYRAATYATLIEMLEASGKDFRWSQQAQRFELN